MFAWAKKNISDIMCQKSEFSDIFLNLFWTTAIYTENNIELIIGAADFRDVNNKQRVDANNYLLPLSDLAWNITVISFILPT